MVKKYICVFCGASSGSSPDFITLAKKIGKMIGENNFNLIYGAGSTGLMGECAKSAQQSGAKVFGNYKKTANNIFESLQIPVTTDMILTGKVPEELKKKELNIQSKMENSNNNNFQDSY